VRLGWSHGDQEVFSRDELVQLFEIEDINRAPSSFSPDKLLWLNQHYIKTLPAKRIAEELTWHLEQQKLDVSQGAAITEVIEAQRERAKTLVELVASSRYFYEPVTNYDEAGMKKQVTADTPRYLAAVAEQLAQLSTWDEVNIHQAIQTSCEQLQVKLGKVGPALRLATTGGTSSPSLEVTLKLLGQSVTLERIQKFITYVENIA
jgi:glutamyl-tRNA synthetase